MAEEYFIDFNDAKDCTFLYNSVLRKKRGVHRINLCKYRARRTDPQNRRYWGFVIKSFGEFLREQGDEFTDLEVHELLKNRYLRKTWVDPKNGERMDYARSTTELDVQEFNEYMEKVENFMAKLGIILPDLTPTES